VSFKLSDEFVAQYVDKKPPFGFSDVAGNSLGEMTFIRTYSRSKEDGSKERWYEVCRRVIEGMYTIQKDHATSMRLPWNSNKAQTSAREAFDRMFNLKWTPPGRGLHQMGAGNVAKGNSASLQNCAVISTGDMNRYDPGYVFQWGMEALMNGIGLGFDTLGENMSIVMDTPHLEPEIFVVPDTREGWADSIRILINSYLRKKHPITFDYSLIRPAGAPLKTFGGTASGPEPLQKLHNQLRDMFDERQGEIFDSRAITDIFNMIAGCVVAGSTRRSAELAMGEYGDDTFLNLKNPEAFPERNSYDPNNPGWAWSSNNSINVPVGADYEKYVERISSNGEPGFIWMDVARSRGRMCDAPDTKDSRAAAFNPCCVAADTKIMTSNGAVEISKIDSDFVAIVDGKEYSALKPWISGVGDVYRLSTEEGFSIDLTPEHRILSSSGEWVEARNLQRGDKIRLTNLNQFEATVESFDFVGRQEVWDTTVDVVHAFDANGIYAHNSEQPLESFETCTLTTVHLPNAESKEDFLRTLKFAFLYAKSVTLMPTNWVETNSVMQRNRRIGLSLTGITDVLDDEGMPYIVDFMESGYDEIRKWDRIYSEWLCIRESNRVTTEKPEGSVSLLSGSSPGVHWGPGGRYYLRAIRFGDFDPMLHLFKAAGYKIEPDLVSQNTQVVYFPIKSNSRRTEKQVSIFEKIGLAAKAQEHWSDNGVSVTVSFDRDSEKDYIVPALRLHEGTLKSVSFLPMGNEVYPQQPYTSITKEEYEEYENRLFKIDWSAIYDGVDGLDAVSELYCSNDSCEIKSVG
jgi:hypothetical protein